MQHSSPWSFRHWSGYYVVSVDPVGMPTPRESEETRRALFMLLHDFRHRDEQALRLFRSLYQVLSPEGIGLRTTGAEFRESADIERFARAVEGAAQLGRLSIVPDARPVAHVVLTPEVPAPTPAPPVAPDPVHYVEIELVDQAGKGLAGEAYRLKLPDGRELTGNLDSNGRASVSGIERPGTCRISFPNLDANAWQ